MKSWLSNFEKCDRRWLIVRSTFESETESAARVGEAVVENPQGQSITYINQKEQKEQRTERSKSGGRRWWRGEQAGRAAQRSKVFVSRLGVSLCAPYPAPTRAGTRPGLNLQLAVQFVRCRSLRAFCEHSSGYRPPCCRAEGGRGKQKAMRHAGRHNATEALSLNSSYSSVCGHDNPGVKDQMAMCR
jgi:hypothetical protein